MDSRDLRNLSEAWENIVTPEVEQLDEMGRPGGNLPGAKTRAQIAAAAEKRMQANVQRAQAPTLPTTRSRGEASRYQAVARDRAAGGQAAYKAGGGDAAARSGLTRQQIQQRGMSATRAATAPVRPSETPAKTTTTAAPIVKPVAKATPTATPVTKPAATAAKPVPAAAPTATPAAPARRSLAQDLEDLRAMRAASAMRQAGQKINGKIPTGADVQAAGQSVSDLNKGARQYLRQDADIFDIVKGYLMSEGYADTEQAAAVIMANMSEEWRQSIIEQRVDVGGGRTVGPVAGAVHSLLTGNLPKSRTYVPPSTQTPTNRAPSIPVSRGDDGKLTDFGKGGGREKMKKTGMTVGQVERLGRRNVGDYSG